MKDSHNPMFSVLVPAYKAEFLSECIESILAQTYKNFELIIVNDASPQDLDGIISKYSDSRIHYFKNEVGYGAEHVVGNWNKCLEYSTGDYVVCMGDDDKLKPNCLYEYSKLIEQNPNVDVFHGWTEIIDENSNIYDINEPRPVWESVYSLIYYRMRGRQQYIGDFLFRSIPLKKIGGFFNLPMAWGSDDITTWLIAWKGGIANSQVPLFLYRKNRQTLSKSGSTTLQMKAINVLGTWLRQHLNDAPDDSIDKLYFQKIIDFIPFYINNRKLGTLKKDYLNNGLIKVFYWLSQRKQYDLPLSIIIRSFASVAKGKL